eukprot:GDKJ01049326.1.p2 GENE.GDKJ01049326.1~~GDKJ01049326.1.p2  ORF type:complete len:404 (+),score=109.58 GDKJ01049326.1:41-1252(+)
MSLTLHYYLYSENSRSHKILAAAAFAGVKVNEKMISLPISDDFKRNCSPLGGNPALETPEGYIFESNAILRYIARLDKTNTLYGKTTYENSMVDAWLDLVASETDPLATHVFAFVRSQTAYPADFVEVSESLFQSIDNWLETRTFLVGERQTIADINLAFTFQVFYRFATNAETLSKKFKNVWRLYNTVMQQPQTVEVLKAVGGSFGLMAKPKEEKKAEPKAEKKKEEKKPKDDEEEEDDMPKEEKKANPLDSLPPSKLVLDAFKREYSNNDTRSHAAPWFFQNFDSEGYTCFWANYKYNEENKMQFMTANLCRGWFQRMEGNRKYAFGVALIVGEDKVHELTSFWVFRGKGLPQCVTDVDDTELFNWVEIKDINAEKEKITDYLCWEGPTIGKPVLEGRTFK